MEAFVWMNFDFSNEILPDSPESIYLQLFNIIQKQIEDGKLDTAFVKAFRVPAGKVVEVFNTTLPYTPSGAS